MGIQQVNSEFKQVAACGTGTRPVEKLNGRWQVAMTAGPTLRLLPWLISWDLWAGIATITLGTLLLSALCLLALGTQRQVAGGGDS